MKLCVPSLNSLIYTICLHLCELNNQCYCSWNDSGFHVYGLLVPQAKAHGPLGNWYYSPSVVQPIGHAVNDNLYVSMHSRSNGLLAVIPMRHLTVGPIMHLYWANWLSFSLYPRAIASWSHGLMDYRVVLTSTDLDPATS